MADALISPTVAAAFYAATGGLLALSCRKLSKDSEFAQKLPLAGILGAFVFSAQMINFAIPGTGSSGHIGGGFLLAALLGPYAAMLVMSSVLVVQCLLFADGGLLALGCNIFNLAFWPAFVGLPLYLLAQKFGQSKAIKLAAVLLAVVASLEAGAFSVVIETVFSGRSDLPFSYFSAFMLGIHFPIAIVEGLLSVAVFSLLERMEGPALRVYAIAQPASKNVYASLISMALLIGGIGAWFASGNPDGLEWSIYKVTQAEDLTPEQSSEQSLFREIQTKTALLPDYSLPQVQESNLKKQLITETEESWPKPNVGTSLSGVLGGVVTALLVLLIGLFLRWNSRSPGGVGV